MQKRKSVVMCMVLAVAMAFSTCLTACGGRRNRNAVPIDESSLGERMLGKYEKTLDLSVGQMISTTEYVEGETASDNVIYNLLNEVMNVKINSQFSATIGDAYNYKLNLAATSNKLPDMFFCPQSQLSDLIDQDMLCDLTDVYEEYASPALRLAMEYSYTGDISVWNNGHPTILKTPQVLESGSYDGKLYGIPFLADIFDQCPLIWLRLDWLKTRADALDIEYEKDTDLLPKNFTEYLKIVDYFTNNDPDGNGADDTYGFSIGYNAKNLQGIANVYNAYPGFYMQDEDGKYYYGSQHENMMPVLKQMNQLYRGGKIDKNSALDGAELKKALAAGKIGTFVGEYWSVMSYGLSDAYLADFDVDWIPWAIRDKSGNIIKPCVHYNISNDAFYCVSSDCPNPEVIILMANHIVDRYFFDDGEYTQKFSELLLSEKYASVASEIEMYAPFRLDAPNKNIRYAYDIQDALKKGNDASLTLSEKPFYQFIKNYLDDRQGKGKKYYPYYKIFCEGGAYTELTNYAQYDWAVDKNDLKVNFMRPAFYGISTPQMIEYGGIVADYEAQELNNMFTGSVSKSVFEKFVKTMNSKGMTKIIEGLNEGL